ncbi:glycosyl hydrolase [Opitutus sp. ER46]|uniref:glycosyl hydrolase n=1 Tax=Opitutus sp. ER46 TaxID=2161864 RepID=UPI000D320740|nr:glycosyl hydrolase [Opitutus sp. ER46]PTY00109.1 glycosyl transferase family 2 [Opitutus sp. ER46]
MHLDRREFIKLGSLTGVALLVAPGRVAAEAAGGGLAADAADALAAGFERVPAAARAGVYWWWLDGRVDREGITRDLEAFAAKGVGEVLLVNSVNFGPSNVPPDAVPFLSPAWRELYRHALREARRLGIEVGVNLSGGWCMGGPWVPPRLAGRWFLQSRLTVEGPQRFTGQLPLPGHRDGYDKVFNPPGFKEYIDLPLEQLDYRDTAVVAVPEPAAGGVRFDAERTALLPAKTNRRDASNFTRARDVMGPANRPLPAAPGDRPVPVDQVVDLTAKMDADGRLTWDVPPGRWTIVRTGHRMTGSRLMIAPKEGDGLSIGWLDRAGVELQFEQLGKLLLEDAAAAGTRLSYFCDDSFEDGFPNWTEKIVAQFRRYRGYDPVPYLPVLAGYIIGSADVADRFLHDYRKTVADLMADEHYGRFAELCHAHGLQVQNEAAGPSRSGTMCMDGLKNLGRSDRPMGEFWLGLRHDEPGGLDPKLGYGVTRLEDQQNKVTKMVSSAAHIYGRRTASAEAFTTGRHWLDAPGTLKPAADRAFCEGINRLIVHESTAVRDRDGKPGHEYYAGSHFNRNQTWWPLVGPFLDYLGRCHFLLQQGLFVADVLAYTGDGAPNVAEPKRALPGLGAGYDYDQCNAEVLLTRATVRDGRIVLPDGMSYRLLLLPDTDRMPREIAAKIRELVRAGATVVGPTPRQDPGLDAYPACDDEVKAIAAEVWGPCDGKAVKTHTCGRGRVFWGVAPRDILAADGVGPDFAFTGGKAWIDFVHRQTPEAEIYFVANRNDRPESGEASFRVAGLTPEIWDPVTGARLKPAAVRSAAGQAVIPLMFAPHQAFFVVFRHAKAAPTTGAVLPLELPVAQEVSGPWRVQFDRAWGGPAEVEFAALTDWTQRPEEGIRFYSGLATYRKRLAFDRELAPGERLFLDLGVVKSIAQVRLNGVELGVVWTAPWRVEITAALRRGENELEIDVANLWPNRLIGDAQRPPEARLTRTNIPLDPKAKLLPSGLLGPVRLTRR